MDSPQDGILNKSAKITILKEFVMGSSKVLEITPEHHLIETSDSRVIEVKNSHVLRVEPYKVKTYDSNL